MQDVASSWVWPDTELRMYEWTTWSAGGGVVVIHCISLRCRGGRRRRGWRGRGKKLWWGSLQAVGASWARAGISSTLSLPRTSSPSEPTKDPHSDTKPMLAWAPVLTLQMPSGQICVGGTIRMAWQGTLPQPKNCAAYKHRLVKGRICLCQPKLHFSPHSNAEALLKRVSPSIFTSARLALLW